ncbi:hypothetical protein J7L87_00865, partial [bacterium]|nr:hypothetical protein [bacterium]
MRKFLLFFFVLSFSVFSSNNIWKIEAESKYIKFQKGVEIVNDEKASGGKALKVPSENVPVWNVVYFSFPFNGKPGVYTLKIRYRYENVADIGKGWRVDIRQRNIINEYGVIYGYYLKQKKGYKDYEINFLWKKSAGAPSVYMRWLGKEGKPVIYLDYFEFIRKGSLPDLRIKEVFPDKIRYLPGEKGNVRVSIENLSSEIKKGELKVELIHDLDEKRLIGEKNIEVEAEKTKDFFFSFKIRKLYGYSVKATLLIKGKVIDEKEEFFTVHKNPWAVAVCGARDEAMRKYYPNWHHVFYNIGATDPLIEKCALNARKEYTTCTEFFSWSPGEPFYMAPEEPIWIRGNGGNLLRSKREIQKEVSELKKYGIACITYLAQQAMGEKTVEILQKKPEWFVYSPTTGDLVEFYRVSELEKQRNFWRKFDWEGYRKYGDPSSENWKSTKSSWEKYVEFWKPYREEVRNFSTIGYFVPNYKLPEVVDYVADQVILSAKIFGWDGLRWDCGHLNTGPLWGSYTPWVDFYGRPLAETKEEMERQTIRNLRRFKKRIRKVFPDFVFGTNFGSKRETSKFPEMTKEFCKDGSWLLDEVSYTYNRPTSPYHTWNKYYEVMAEQGDYVLSLGG